MLLFVICLARRHSRLCAQPVFNKHYFRGQQGNHVQPLAAGDDEDTIEVDPEMPELEASSSEDEDFGILLEGPGIGLSYDDDTSVYAEIASLD